MNLITSPPNFIVFNHGPGGVVINFAVGDVLLFANGPPGDSTVEYSLDTPVVGFGMQVATSLFAPFTATLEAFSPSGESLGEVSRDGVSNSNLDNSAIFIGIFDEVSFDRVRLTMPGLFFQNQVDILTSGSLQTIPEPATVLLLATGLAALGWRVRRGTKALCPERRRARPFLSAATLFSILAVLHAVPARGGSMFMGLGYLPGGSHSDALGVSADGSVVVGRAGSDQPIEAFRWTLEDGIQGLGVLIDGDTRSTAVSSSADGSSIVGWSQDDLTGHREGFVWTESEGMVGLGLGSFDETAAFDVSGSGATITGRAVSVTEVDRLGEPFRWTQSDGVVGLGYLPGYTENGNAIAVSGDGSVVVGVVGSSISGPQAFRWTEADGMTGLGWLPGRTNSNAQGISADGSTIVGVSGSATTDSEAFRWTDEAGMVPLGDLEGGRSLSLAYDASGDGSAIVGASNTGTTATNGNEAFIWDEENGMRLLQNVLEQDFGLNLDGWTLREANAISDDGLTIIGTGTNPSGGQEAWIAVIPEPSTVLLLATGLAALAWRVRRA